MFKTQLGDEDANDPHAASAAPSTDSDSRSSVAACIRKCYQKALALSDKKVKLAEETYALVCIMHFIRDTVQSVHECE